MEAKPKEIRIYTTSDNIAPFSQWRDSLKDNRARAKIRTRLDRVESGNLGDYKFVGEGVYELRIDYGARYRIYFGQESNMIIFLLWGGDKSTQTKDIAKAQVYWKDYRSRYDV
ncbi:type II toxin-antitoxin system RelE/ParE family toxin [Spirulina sp. CS-785/01]|uniref:type II toxin-antitoxin system RelE/ParE family toxin n=1 Tax=Spirulina sp. CS-785/01 TaxID=3021716 RepID=UPI00232D110B|nr:type II toxin-antitoxin system RelE/ParE family toxin [Spirulina sp. CS-785/01]MDB9311898.1 type II toxin-antitoxin system RelE/ParE family toxin [Spirulina sp. CS-785/01]